MLKTRPNAVQKHWRTKKVQGLVNTLRRGSASSGGSKQKGRENSRKKLGGGTFCERTRRAPSGVEGSAVRPEMRPRPAEKSRLSSSRVALRDPSQRQGSPKRRPLPTPGASPRRAAAGPDPATGAGGAASPDSRSPGGPPGRTPPARAPRLPVAPAARG